MGSNCQQSQPCTDVMNTFRGVPASSGPAVLTAFLLPHPLTLVSGSAWGTSLLEEQENQTMLSRRNMDVSFHSWLALPGSTRLKPGRCGPNPAAPSSPD